MRTLNEALISECSAMNDEEALTHIKGLTVTVDGISEGGLVLSYIASISKLKTFRLIAEDDSNPLQDAADAALITLNKASGFDFTIQVTVDMLAAFVTANVLTQAESDIIRGIGQSVNPEFPGVRMVDILGAR